MFSENNMDSGRDVNLYKQQIGENNKLIDALRKELNQKFEEV